MDAQTRAFVRQRAGNICEYCLLPQWAVPDTVFHIEHIIADQHGGSDDFGNLALSCDRCNFNKGPNLSSIDPKTNAVVRLFDPRSHRWGEHFCMLDGQIVGLTTTGRATVVLLKMNAPHRLRIRRALGLI